MSCKMGLSTNNLQIGSNCWYIALTNSNSSNAFLRELFFPESGLERRLFFRLELTLLLFHSTQSWIFSI